jgi:hypothetical protein
MVETTCAHCGTKGDDQKRCGTCKNTFYCDAECQKSHWKQHKKSCAKPLPIEEVKTRLDKAYSEHEWQEVLVHEPRMEDLLATFTSKNNYILRVFADAHERGFRATGIRDHCHSTIRIEQRRGALMGWRGAFADQGRAMCSTAMSYSHVQMWEEARTYFELARDLGETHFLMDLESEACSGLGDMAMAVGDAAEGLQLLRNALTSAEATYADHSLDNNRYVHNALVRLIEALFRCNTVDMDAFFEGSTAVEELDPLVPRFCEMAKTSSCTAEIHSLYFKALLHEVVISPTRVTATACQSLTRA